MRQRLSAPPERALAAAGATLLAGALAIRTEPVLLASLVAGAICLLGWSLWPTRSVGRACFIIANLGLLLLYLWSSLERSELRVEVHGGRIEATLGPAHLAATTRVAEPSSVALAIAAADERPLATRWSYPNLPWVEGAGLWLAENLRAGLVDATVRAVDGGALARQHGPLWQAAARATPPTLEGTVEGWSIRPDPRHGLVLEAEAPGGGFSLTVTLLRPSSDVRVLVSSAGRGGDTEVVVTAAPDRRTFTIEEQIGRQQPRTLTGGLFAYKRDALSWCQALSRELLRPWLFALLLLALARVLVAPTRSRKLRAPAPGRSLPPAATAGALGAAAVAATAPIALFVLEGIPHVQDSVTYLFQAQLFALGRLAAPAPALPEFFEQEFVVVRGGEWFGKYPPGQPLLLAIGVLLGCPWLVSPIAAGGAVGFTYLAARRLYGPAGGVLSALLLLSSPFFLLMSGSMMAHLAGLFWTSGHLLGVVSCRQHGACWVWAGTGFALGMLLITRQLTAAAVGAPLLAPLALQAFRAPGRTLPRAALLVAGAAPPIMFLLFFNWRLLGDPFESPHELWWDFDRVGFGPTIGMHGGHDLANGLANTWANSSELLRHLFGWPPYLTLAPALVPFLTLRRHGWDWILGATVVSLVGAYVAYWADGIMYGPRYYYEIAGVVAILTARGVTLLAQAGSLSSPARAETRSDHSTPGTARWAVGAALVAAVGLNLIGYLPPTILAHRGFNGISRARLDLVEQADLGRALVFVTQRSPDWQPYGSVFPANGPLLDGPIIFARDPGDADNARLRAAHPDRRAYLLRDMQLTELVP